MNCPTCKAPQRNLGIGPRPLWHCDACDSATTAKQMDRSSAMLDPGRQFVELCAMRHSPSEIQQAALTRHSYWLKAEEAENRTERDTIFRVLQKDILEEALGMVKLRHKAPLWFFRMGQWMKWVAK